MKKLIALLFFILLLSGCGTNQEKNQGDEMSNHDTVTKEGVYVGLADTHTIEVTVDNEPVSFDITDESTSDLDNLNNGDKVKVKYEKNEKGQLLLKDIERTN
ncbi:hypothetical protein MOC98_09020 [Bacillus spizizenii]|uniref:Membrane-bound protein LytA n=1 Tax=Bacillus spizizenii TaxID=96241 RepID=A0A9Q4E2H5_BACSC|nr:hypothetical protein [Bacillus spizizenii]MCY8456728.1 hypothetical protein [Bacillus spizizenii]